MTPEYSRPLVKGDNIAFALACSTVDAPLDESGDTSNAVTQSVRAGDVRSNEVAAHYRYRRCVAAAVKVQSRSGVAGDDVAFALIRPTDQQVVASVDYNTATFIRYGLCAGNVSANQIADDSVRGAAEKEAGSGPTRIPRQYVARPQFAATDYVEKAGHLNSGSVVSP